MLYKGLLFAAASGKLNGTVWSHNRGGTYVRSLSIPVDPDTVQQEYCRAAMADLSQAWNEMTDGERIGWENYAASRTYLNRIGEQRKITGRQAWSAFALPQYQQVEALDLARVVRKTAPLYPVADFFEAPLTTLPNLTTLTISWIDDNTWEGSPDANNGFVVHIGRPHSPRVHWYQSPFQITHWVEGDEDVPIVSPIDLTIPIALRPTTGQALDIRIRLFREDRPNGRVWQSRAIAP